MPQASIIIPAYNAARFIRQTVDSALAQTLDSFEVIVVDDGSNDDTAAILAGYGHSIKTICRPNGGPAAARNTGIRAAQSDYFLFLDSDDVIPPQKLELHLQFLKAHPEFGLAYSAWQTISEDGEHVLAEVRPAMQGHLLKEILLRSFFFYPSSAVLRRQLFEQVGLFDERFRGMEDIDMWLRLARAGCNFGYIDQLLLKYRIRNDSLYAKVNPTDIDHQFLVLDQFFANPELSPEITALKTEAYTILHYETAFRCFRHNNLQLGQRHLSQAAALSRQVPNDPDWLAQRFAYFALDPRSAHAPHLLELVFDNLPAASELQSLRRKVYAHYHVISLFMAHQRHRPADIRRHILPAVWANPAVVLNRGFLSISLKALSGSFLQRHQPESGQKD